MTADVKYLVTLSVEFSSIPTNSLCMERGADGEDYYRIDYEIEATIFSSHIDHHCGVATHVAGQSRPNMLDRLCHGVKLQSRETHMVANTLTPSRLCSLAISLQILLRKVGHLPHCYRSVNSLRLAGRVDSVVRLDGLCEISSGLAGDGSDLVFF